MFSCSAAATAVDRSTCVQCYHSPADGISLLRYVIRVAVSVQYCARNPFLFSVCI